MLMYSIWDYDDNVDLPGPFLVIHSGHVLFLSQKNLFLSHSELQDSSNISVRDNADVWTLCYNIYLKKAL